jgi:hypothetical protein
MDFVMLTDWAWVLGVLGLAVAGGIYVYLQGQSAGTAEMQDLADQIHDGAMAFLRREYTVLAVFVAVVAVLLGFAIGQDTAIAYVAGALASVAAGYFGMKAATRANVRTSAAANQEGQGKALRIAFFGGAVMGLSVASLGLIGLGVLYWIYASSAIPGRTSSPTSPRSSPASPWEPVPSPSSPGWGVGSTPRPPMWEPTWWGRWKPGFRRTTPGTPPPSPTTWATTWVTWPGWAPTSSSPTWGRWWPPSPSGPRPLRWRLRRCRRWRSPSSPSWWEWWRRSSPSG